MDNSSYGIEPLVSSLDFQHLVYRLEDVVSEPLVCGTPHTEQLAPSEQDHSEHHTHSDTHKQPVSHLLRVSYHSVYVCVLSVPVPSC
jgi:hypothetical protein